MAGPGCRWRAPRCTSATLLLGAGTPLVAEEQGRIVAGSVLYEGAEPEPYGRHLSMNHPTVLPGHDVKRAVSAMLAAAREELQQRELRRLLLPLVLPELQEDYASRGFSRRARILRVSLPARVGQGFYRSSDWTDPAPRKIAGWSMPIGRVGSARQQWEALWPDTWGAIAEMRRHRVHRLQFDASGHEALVCCRQQPLRGAQRGDFLLVAAPADAPVADRPARLGAPHRLSHPDSERGRGDRADLRPRGRAGRFLAGGLRPRP